MERKRWIVNTRTLTYVEATWELPQEWEDSFPHTTGSEVENARLFNVWEDQKTNNGIYYVYSLSRDGAHFLLLADITKTSEEQIQKSINEIRGQHDVLTLKVLRLKPA